MSIVSLFTRREQIVGIDISTTEVRLAVLREDKKEGQKIILLASEKVPAETIVAGIVQKPDILASVLRNLSHSAREGRKKAIITYAVISIPCDAAYTRLYGFPSSITGARLEETMKLTVGFQLPHKIEDIYLDWEKVGDNSDNRVLLSAIKKSVVDGYLVALRDAGIHPVALELHPASIVRSAAFTEDTTLLVEESSDAVSVSLINKKILRFVRVIPKSIISEEKMPEEIRKISDFAEAEGMKPSHTTTVGALAVREPFSLYPNLKDNGGAWLVAIGAAARGLISRDKDTLVSLLPVGTEIAYAYQKAQIFSAFVSNVIVGLSLFFALSFVGVWLLMVSLEQKTVAQIERVSSLPLPESGAGLEERALKLNALIAQTSPIIKSFPIWSPVLNEIKARVTEGVLITGISITDPANPVGITGIAKTRQSLNEFKRSLDDSLIFGTITLPLTNLEQRENIPFSISFVLEKLPYVQ